MYVFYIFGLPGCYLPGASRTLLIILYSPSTTVFLMICFATPGLSVRSLVFLAGRLVAIGARPGGSARGIPPRISRGGSPGGTPGGSHSGDARGDDHRGSPRGSPQWPPRPGRDCYQPASLGELGRTAKLLSRAAALVYIEAFVA